MGLDWNPGPRAKSGCEQEFQKLWHKLAAKSCFFRNRKQKRFDEITESAFQTLATPQVGWDERANKWAEEAAFPNRQNKSLTKEAFLNGMKGFYVLDLVPPCDGIPRYTNGHAGGYVERFSFRAQWLQDSVDIIGEKMFEEAYNSKLPADTVAYGEQLLSLASEYAEARRLIIAERKPDADPDSLEFKFDVVLSAGRWCRFWGAKGHWLEAYW